MGPEETSNTRYPRPTTQTFSEDVSHTLPMHQPMLTLDFLDRATDLYGDVTGVVAHDGTEFTYREFGERVNALSRALQERGLEQGDRVAILAPNTHWFLESLYAVNQLGMVTVPLNYRLISEDYAYILNDCEASAILADVSRSRPNCSSPTGPRTSAGTGWSTSRWSAQRRPIRPPGPTSRRTSPRRSTTRAGRPASRKGSSGPTGPNTGTR